MTEAEREAALVEEHFGLVHTLSRRLMRSGVSVQDLQQAGALGLLKAIRGFDPARGFAFSTYAVPVILGEMRAFLRGEGSVSVSRSIRQNAAKLCRARETLGEGANIAALSKAAGISAEDAALALGASLPTESLSEEGAAELPYTEEGFAQALLRADLSRAWGALNARERKLLALRYHRALTQSQCARLLGISQAAVSRAEQKALRCLREKLA